MKLPCTKAARDNDVHVSPSGVPPPPSSSQVELAAGTSCKVDCAPGYASPWDGGCRACCTRGGAPCRSTSAIHGFYKHNRAGVSG